MDPVVSPPPALRRTAVISLLMLLAVAVCPAADPTPPLEYRVKAAFLLNFAKFVEWPETAASADTNLAMCIIGEDPFGDALDQLVQGEAVGARKIVVQRHLAPSPSKCDVAYIGKQTRDVAAILETLGPGVLTVGEGESFLRAGGVIAFVIDNRRVRFDVSQSAARKSSVRLSSRLLGVARSVER